MITAIAVVGTAFAFGCLVGFRYGSRGLWKMMNHVVELDDENERLKLRAVGVIAGTLDPSMDVRLQRANFAPVER